MSSPDTITNLNLNYLVLGLGNEPGFVSISREANVADLQELIKQQQGSAYREIETRSFQLFQVSLDFSDVLEENLITQLRGQRPLVAVMKLSMIFKELPEEGCPRLHIVVKPPPKINCLLLGTTEICTFTISRHATVEDLRESIRLWWSTIYPSTFTCVKSALFQLFHVPFDFNDVLPDDLAEVLQGRKFLSVPKKLSTLCEESSMEGWLNIVVKLPPIAKIVCFLYGSQVFTVTIPMSADIDALKDFIHRLWFREVDPLRVNLYQVSLPYDDNFNAKLEQMQLNDQRPMNLGTISTLFESAVEGHVQIIIKLAPEPRMVPSMFQAQPPTDAVVQGRSHFLKEYRPKPPSSQAEPRTFRDSQSIPNLRIYCNRPGNASPLIPVTLYHPIFGQFVDDGKTQPTPEDNSAVLTLSRIMSDVYDDEKARAEAVRLFFTSYGVHLQPGELSGTAFRTDGHIELDGRPYCFTDFKNEVGSKGAEPYFQTSCYFVEGTRPHAANQPGSVLPCIIMLVFGPYLSFVGAAWSDRPNLQVLSPVIPFQFHHSDVEMRLMAARYLRAFKVAVNSLKQYYESQISSIDPTPLPFPRSLFPYPTSFTSRGSDTEQHFQYLQQSFENKLIFFGELSGSGCQICIKFVRQYCEEAHSLCASKGVAPKLFAVSIIPGGWFMVVMDRLGDHFMDYNTFRESKEFDHDRVPNVLDKIQETLAELHEAGYVHGDVRDTNIMVSEDSGPMLIDYDWAGKAGEVRYPICVNSGTGLWRPDSAVDGELIQIEHDVEMLQRIIASSRVA